MIKEQDIALYFSLFNEVGIIEQLARNRFEAALPKGMSMAQFTMLNHLIRVGNGHTPQRIARALQLPKTSISHTLALLESKKLIKVTTNPDDARSKLVWTTKKGEALRDKCIALVAPDFMEVAGQIPAKDAKALVTALAQVREIMDRARD